MIMNLSVMAIFFGYNLLRKIISEAFTDINFEYKFVIGFTIIVLVNILMNIIRFIFIIYDRCKAKRNKIKEKL